MESLSRQGNVIHKDAFLTGIHSGKLTELQLLTTPLNPEDLIGIQRLSYGKGHGNPAARRSKDRAARQNGRDMRINPKHPAEPDAEHPGVAEIPQGQRHLEVVVGVHSRWETEVPFTKGTGFCQDLCNLFLGKMDLSHHEGDFDPWNSFSCFCCKGRVTSQEVGPGGRILERIMARMSRQTGVDQGKAEEARASSPFLFYACSEILELLGVKATDELQLLESLEEVPLDSIYSHTHGYFLRRKGVFGAYPNDFATWVAIQVRDRVLGERLGVLSPFDFRDLEELRSEMIRIIDDHLSHLHIVPRVLYGEPFYFTRSHFVEIPTGVEAWTLEEFFGGLERVDVSAVFYHQFRSSPQESATPHGLEKSGNDFASWISKELGLEDLGEEIRGIHPYFTTLEDYRDQVVGACRRFQGQRKGHGPEQPGRS